MQGARRAIDAVAANDLCAMQTCGVRRLVAVTERSTIASETVALTFDTSETAVTALRAV